MKTASQQKLFRKCFVLCYCYRKDFFSLAYAWEEDILNHITWGEETVKGVIHNFWMQKSGIK